MSRSTRGACVWPRAHPRSRGENIDRYPRHYCTAGSSPLTRGKQWWGEERCPASGLIPAHAGKTRASRAWMMTGGAHPRSRGENDTFEAALIAASGSSPLTRGKRAGGPCARGRRRLIPAHAGKTWSGRPRTRSRAAHPRSRGENVTMDRICGDVRGSSPLTRGKQCRAGRFC